MASKPEGATSAPPTLEISGNWMKPNKMAFVLALIVLLAGGTLVYKGVGGVDGVIASGTSSLSVSVASIIFGLYQTYKKDKKKDKEANNDDKKTKQAAPTGSEGTSASTSSDNVKPIEKKSEVKIISQAEIDAIYIDFTTSRDPNSVRVRELSEEDLTAFLKGIASKIRTDATQYDVPTNRLFNAIKSNPSWNKVAEDLTPTHKALIQVIKYN